MTIIKSVFKYFFGKDKTYIWEELAGYSNGKYSVAPGGIDQVDFVHKNIAIKIDLYTNYSVAGGSSYEREYIRGRACFVSSDQLKFRLTGQGFIENIGKIFGAQDIQIGDTETDRKFMIKGNDEAKVQLIFSNPNLKNILQHQRLLRLELTDDEGLFAEQIPEGQFMLYFASDEKLSGLGQLKDCCDLFKITIDELLKAGSIAKPAVQ